LARSASTGTQGSGDHTPPASFFPDVSASSFEAEISTEIGAALSPALGGALAQAVGYRIAFLILAAFAPGSLALWIGFRKVVKPMSEIGGEGVPAASPA
jgi:MFS family permease